MSNIDSKSKMRCLPRIWRIACPPTSLASALGSLLTANDDSTDNAALVHVHRKAKGDCRQYSKADHRGCEARSEVRSGRLYGQ